MKPNGNGLSGTNYQCHNRRGRLMQAFWRAAINTFSLVIVLNCNWLIASPVDSTANDMTISAPVDETHLSLYSTAATKNNVASSTITANEASAAIIYPQMREPYASLYQETLAGIKETFAGETHQYALEKNYQPKEVKRWLARHQPQVLIALGQRGATLCQQLKPTGSVVLGALLFVPEPCAERQLTVSLTADPEQLFIRLKALKPTITRIFVVYDREVNHWLVALAKRRAQSLGIQLVAITTDSLQQSAFIYRDLLPQLNVEQDALWLLQDRKAIDNANLLPMLLREAWENRFIIFSSNLAHVKNGVLFALYPDNFSLGTHLGRLASLVTQSMQNLETVQASPNSKAALNRRAAQHLGLNLTAGELTNYELVFPND